MTKPAPSLSLRLFSRFSRVLPGLVAGGVVATQVGMRVRGGGG